MSKRSRPRSLDSEDIPFVCAADLFVCDDCGKVHLVLFNHNREPIGQFANTDDQWTDLIKVITEGMAARHVH
jgi:hypothetical protein